jgi:hypothetical protein
MKKILGHPANFSAASLGDAGDRTDLGKACSGPHLHAPREQENGRKNPGHLRLKTDS